jgi:hypothetical protein
MAKGDHFDRAGWRVTRLWVERSSDGRRLDYADTEDFSDIKDAWARYHEQCIRSGQVDLYDVAKGAVIASNTWPDGWKPGVRHEQRRLTTDG